MLFEFANGQLPFAFAFGFGFGFGYMRIAICELQFAVGYCFNNLNL